MREPAHRILSGRVLDQIIEDAGYRPFHLEHVVVGASGGYMLLGTNVGTSWVEHRRSTVSAGTLPSDPAPTGGTNGTLLLEYPQARFYVEFVNGSGPETVDIVVWHRHHPFEDPKGSPGPWTKGQTFTKCSAFQEYIVPGLWHREIFLQFMNYADNAAGTTSEVRTYVAGSSGLYVPPVPITEILDNTYSAQTFDLSAGIAADTSLGWAGRQLIVLNLTGTASIKFNSASNPSIDIFPGDRISNFEFTDVLLTAPAQPGKTLTLMATRRI